MITTIEKSYGGFMIGKIKQIQARVFAKMMSEDGIEELNGAQGRILFVLWQEDNITISCLSERTGLAKTSLTSMLDRLEKSYHIQRVYSKSDRREIRICLTDKARSLKDKYDRVSQRMTELFYTGFSDDEIIAFEKSLERILETLTKAEKGQAVIFPDNNTNSRLK